MLRFLSARLTRAVLLLTMIACGGGGDAGSGPGPGTPTITVALSQSTLSLAAGQAQPLVAAVAGSVNTAVTWSTSAPAVATVSATGVVTGVAPGTATITATSVADPSRSAVATVTVTGVDAVTLLSGVPLTSQSGSMDSQRLFRVLVPAGATRLEVRTAGGTGDLDLYLRAGVPPTESGIDCRSEGDTNDELCAVTNPAAGTWYVLLYGYEAYSGATLTATVTAGGGPGTGTPAIAVAASPTAVSLTPGGSVPLSVTVTRSGGYTGAVTVGAEGLPPGVSAAGISIPSGATSGTLTLTASSTASGSATVTLRARGSGVADATTSVPTTVAAPGGGTGTIGISFSQPSLRIEQNSIGHTTVRIQRNGYTGTIQLGMDAVPATEHFIIPLFEKAVLEPGESETQLRLRVHHNFGATSTSVRIRARTASGVETTAELPITIPQQYVFKGGFTAASWRMYTISSAGDRCEYLVGMSGTITVTVDGLHQTGSMTTRIQGTMESKAVQASVGQTTCNSGTTSVDVSKTSQMMFPSLNNMVERKFTSWGVQFWVESQLKVATDSWNPGNSPGPGTIRLQVNGSTTAGIVGEQPRTLDILLLRQ